METKDLIGPTGKWRRGSSEEEKEGERKGAKERGREREKGREGNNGVEQSGRVDGGVMGASAKRGGLGV